MKSNKRIAFISDHASPLATLGNVDTGGQNVYVAQLTKHLALHEGCLIDIYTRRDSLDLDNVVEWLPGVRVININAGPAEDVIKEDLLPYMDEFKFNMLQFIANECISYDLIHANFFMSALVAMEIKKELDIPFAVTFHALGHIRRLHQAENDKFPVERLKIEEDAVQQADLIIAECPQDRQDIIQYYHAPVEKIVIVPCGFSDEEFYPINKSGARRLLGLPADCHLLLQLGRMVPRKGIDNVIRAVADLKNKTAKPVKLLIVGGDCDNMADSLCPEFRRLIKLADDLNVTEQIIFSGKKGRNILKYFYSAADLFITTPWYEPFGITPLEAMACGTPVIGSKVGGIKYSVKNNHSGVLIKPHKPQLLADKVAALLANDSLLSQMSFNAINRVNKYFTWSRIAAEMNKAYSLTVTVSKQPNLVTGMDKKEYQAA